MTQQIDKYRAEFLKRNSAPYFCFFCEEKITLFKGSTKWAMSIHHLDGDHDNNDPANWASAHCSCHSSYHRKGTKLSEETRAKMSAAHKGKKFSPETRAKMSLAAMGNQRGLGHKHSPETCAKMSESHKLRNRAK